MQRGRAKNAGSNCRLHRGLDRLGTLLRLSGSKILTAILLRVRLTDMLGNLARTGAALYCAIIATASQRPSVIEAVHKGHAVGYEQDGIAAVRVALAAGGDVNERDNRGWTPLMHA